jgi:hypothetical protein
MKQRLPLILSVAALAVALLGSTPLGHAARRAVPFALFAQNAGKVDGISASHRPKPGMLLPLGSNRKFPPSVVPEGPRGPEGPQGPQGPQGAPAVKLYAVVNQDGTMYRGAGATSAQRDDVGEYEVLFNQNVDNCAAVASTGSHQTGAGGSSSVPLGMASTWTHGSAVTVITRTPGGFNPFQALDRGFHLVVVC